jgi:hypothetical protein
LQLSQEGVAARHARGCSTVAAAGGEAPQSKVARKAPYVPRQPTVPLARGSWDGP